MFKLMHNLFLLVVYTGKPCQPKNLVLYTNTSASGTLHWKRPHCMSELVTLSYNVTVTSITDTKVVYKVYTDSYIVLSFHFSYTGYNK